MKKHPLHIFLWISIVLISIFTASAIGYIVFANKTTSEIILPSETTTAETDEVPQPVTLMFVGDMMFDRGVESSVKRNFNGDFNTLFDHLEILEKADIVFGNLEGPVSDKGSNVGSKYSFRMDPVILPILKNHGFDIVSFANNHVGDWSSAAFEDTLERLKQNNIAFTGAGLNKKEAEQVTILEENGIRIGFIGFTDVGPNWLAASETKPGILLASDPNFSQIIRDAKAQTDILITSFHWGNEYVPFSNRQQVLAHRAVDAGADLVIGHHPHVIQASEYYKGKLIAYSLGNFIFDQYFSDETMQGMLLEIDIDTTGIVSVKEHIIELARTYQPIQVRDATDADTVKSKVTVPSLCPPSSGRSENKWLFPVNRVNSLGAYIPPSLTHMPNRVETRGTATCLTTETADALEKMFSAMITAGLKPVMTSGYRSADTQRMVYADWLSRQNGIMPEYPAVAEPGHSEHQLGTTVDIKSLQTAELSYDAFGASPEYRWMTQHAHMYGFVQSYPQGKESITGYIPEPWHWRYIGIERAERFSLSGKTLSEFLATE
jgi:LAS superfamily LD-carboxypeptidase LdcB